MKILMCISLLLLAACATEQEKIDWAEKTMIADERYEEVKQYCSSIGLSVNVECEAGRACQKRPSNREKLTAYCVRWINTRSMNTTTISDRVYRDMERESRRRF